MSANPPGAGELSTEQLAQLQALAGELNPVQRA
jgi:hypothetical protein